MEPKDPIVEALISLCNESGGYEKVADKAGVSAANLWQIVVGTKLPSGKPRGVGPRLREAISNAYPNWLELHYPAVIRRQYSVPDDVQERADKETRAIFTLDKLPESTNQLPLGESNSTGQTSGHEIKRFDTGGAMGNGVVLKDQPGVIESWQVSQEWIQKNVKSFTSAKNLCVVTGFGDSMRGLFNPGDPLLVDIGVTSVDFEGVYFFRVAEEGFVKRLQRIPGQGLLVISENTKYRDWTVTKDMDFQVFGRVVKVWCGEEL